MIGNWQDYRGKEEGVLIHLSTTRLHALPTHEPVDSGGEPLLEPNTETGTFGFLSCIEARSRLAALKSRRRYFLFGTRYQGLLETFRGRFLVIGYMRLDKTLDVRKRHVHKWMENDRGSRAPECMDMEECPAFQSGEMNFYAPEDAFELSEGLMQAWGYKGKITKQMKLTFSEHKLSILLEHFKSKTIRNNEYWATLQELSALGRTAQKSNPG